MAKTHFKSVTEYIAARPKHVRATLELVRSTIRKAVPAAEEGISYQIPVYKLNGLPVICFAGWKQHYSIYPASDNVVSTFKKDLAAYELTKGTIRFPLSEPVPVKLIAGIAKLRAKDVGSPGRSSARKTQLERVRRMCSALPSASEKVSHGAPTFFVEKDAGVFAVFADSHHGDGHLAVWLPAPPGLQSALIGDAPETYFKPPYVGPSGWIGIELDRIDDEALAIHIREAWELAAAKPKKKTRQRL
jgi:uncharacterized protein YdhG (YjbR/CyaY superfamily)